MHCILTRDRCIARRCWGRTQATILHVNYTLWGLATSSSPSLSFTSKLDMLSWLASLASMRPSHANALVSPSHTRQESPHQHDSVTIYLGCAQSGQHESRPVIASPIASMPPRCYRTARCPQAL